MVHKDWTNGNETRGRTATTRDGAATCAEPKTTWRGNETLAQVLDDMGQDHKRVHLRAHVGIKCKRHKAAQLHVDETIGVVVEPFYPRVGKRTNGPVTLQVRSQFTERGLDFILVVGQHVQL